MQLFADSKPGDDLHRALEAVVDAYCNANLHGDARHLSAPVERISEDMRPHVLAAVERGWLDLHIYAPGAGAHRNDATPGASMVALTAEGEDALCRIRMLQAPRDSTIVTRISRTEIPRSTDPIRVDAEPGTIEAARRKKATTPREWDGVRCRPENMPAIVVDRLDIVTAYEGPNGWAWAVWVYGGYARAVVAFGEAATSRRDAMRIARETAAGLEFDEEGMPTWKMRGF